ncbi:uncharacterized protein BDCG_17477 [Blastomyces dermatitidis ER-3]|uniref:Uncharacterized protein n=2 Tax=Ajellomyces dermatitidis TaxID=5039 RepID=A0A0J9ENE2_AJEDA|nr:uncharacterized protein BDCG_17477 [Blastomyces dermatitidis ER-3]KMW66795.1 hypothetical protein BDDG_11724 [Blastomyces dermatitidis ATCC 18188]OAT02277.1 hypothetical protein BDCG_17477 [Blastomyces dermatitidis ER-3]
MEENAVQGLSKIILLFLSIAHTDMYICIQNTAIRRGAATKNIQKRVSRMQTRFLKLFKTFYFFVFETDPRAAVRKFEVSSGLTLLSHRRTWAAEQESLGILQEDQVLKRGQQSERNEHELMD